MALFIEIKSGKSQGLKFQIHEGLKIGRSRGDIQIDEPKMSSLHAEFLSNEKGQLYLIDSGSTNGIKFRKKRVRRVPIKASTEFQIGETLFSVIEENSEPTHESLPLKYPDKNVMELATHKKPTHLELKEILLNLDIQNRPQETQLFAFKNPVELFFLEGSQKGALFSFEYGPRYFGAFSLDFEILEPEAPEIAFTLSPDPSGTIFFETQFPDKVKLNAQNVPQSTLKNGDIIQIGMTLLELRIQND